MSNKEPLDAVHRYIDAFNRADVKAMAEAFASSASILDGLPPHSWQGPKAGQQWYRDVIAAGEHEGAGDYSVTIGDPWHVNVTGDSAYVVVPATMKFNVHGKAMTQTGSVYTVALRKVESRWLITAWSWAKGTNSQ
jgi:ketosteroid isomerase-like protein